MLFNHSSSGEVDKFLSKLKVVKTGVDEKSITCSELKTEADYKAASVTRQSMMKPLLNLLAKSYSSHHFLVLTVANNTGFVGEVSTERSNHR